MLVEKATCFKWWQNMYLFRSPGYVSGLLKGQGNLTHLRERSKFPGNNSPESLGREHPRVCFLLFACVCSFLIVPSLHGKSTDCQKRSSSQGQSARGAPQETKNNIRPSDQSGPLRPDEHGCKEGGGHKVQGVVGHDPLPKEELRIRHLRIHAPRAWLKTPRPPFTTSWEVLQDTLRELLVNMCSSLWSSWGGGRKEELTGATKPKGLTTLLMSWKRRLSSFTLASQGIFCCPKRMRNGKPPNHHPSRSSGRKLGMARVPFWVENSGKEKPLPSSPRHRGLRAWWWCRRTHIH